MPRTQRFPNSVREQLLRQALKGQAMSYCAGDEVHDDIATQDLEEDRLGCLSDTRRCLSLLKQLQSELQDEAIQLVDGEYPDAAQIALTKRTLSMILAIAQKREFARVDE